MSVMGLRAGFCCRVACSTLMHGSKSHDGTQEKLAILRRSLSYPSGERRVEVIEVVPRCQVLEIMLKVLCIRSVLQCPPWFRELTVVDG